MAAKPASLSAPPHPIDRQVLANVGNRYVVFSSQIAVPGRPMLGPGDVKIRFAERVGDETDFPEERLVRSIQVQGAEVLLEPSPADDSDRRADLAVSFANGTSVLVEIVVQQRDFRGKELERHWSELRDKRRNGQARHEVWNFNIERLKLTVLWADDEGLPQFCDLDPLNVWEFNEDGSVFDRAILVSRVEDWLHRLDDLYKVMDGWANAAGLTPSRARTILMSEELIQRFAIPDRELSILDFDRDSVPVMSAVPVGLWVLGSNGRLDLINPTEPRS